MWNDVSALKQAISEEIITGIARLQRFWWVRNKLRLITSEASVEQYVPTAEELAAYDDALNPMLEFYNALRTDLNRFCADELIRLGVPPSEYRVFIYLYPRHDVSIDITVTRHNPPIPSAVETTPVSG